MFIKNIKLNNFRNYKRQEINLNKNTNIIFGDNATGKTTILESIFICSLGKSFRTNKDNELINKDEKNANIEIEFVKKDRKGKINLKLSEKKHFFINDIKLKKTSEILGNIYIVLFSPEDIGILNNEPSKRRRFLNIMISQLKPLYVHSLNQYSKILEQRNNYLKQIKYENKDINLLDIWDEQLYNLGIKIYNYRKDFIKKINEKIEKIHLEKTKKKEKIKIKYKTNIKDENEYLEKMKKNRNLDVQKGFTSIGVHRDDFDIFINNEDVSIYGSQGQKRTSLISLKLAEAEVIYDEIEEYPIILLDDFMSELDQKRIKGFIKNIKNNQVLVTCTEELSLDNMDYNLYKVDNATIKNINKI